MDIQSPFSSLRRLIYGQPSVQEQSAFGSLQSLFQRRAYNTSRGPPPDFRNFSRDLWGKRVIMWGCVAANLGVFYIWWRSQSNPRLNRWLYDNFTLSMRNVQQSRPWTMITAAFSHQDAVHIGFNLLAFTSFAGFLVHMPGLGPIKFSTLIFGSVLGGSLAFLRNDQAESNRFSHRVGLGFSGAVSGLVTAVAAITPWTQVRIWGVLPMPMILMAMGYVAIDTYFMREGGSKIGHDAHLGGAAAGTLWYIFFGRRFGGLLARGGGWR